MVSIADFDQALPYERFLHEFGTPADRERWDRNRQRIELSEEQQRLLRLFQRQTHVLVLAGAWCGDCAAQCPIFEVFAECAPVLKIRYLDRDTHPQVQQALMINGGQRVPVVVFFSEDGYEVARYGERTLSAYRARVASLVNLPNPPDPNVSEVSGMVADWLREFERVQWILRLSPRLRRLHGD
jgi:thiol-disulfide isomerase/thioredoxin